jgi:hypothetical protein
MSDKKLMHRRTFLRGAFGATFALPLLDGLAWQDAGRPALAADPQTPPFFLAVRAGNGVQQAQDGGGEPERWWPAEMGALSAAMMTRVVDGDMRATGELAPYADRLNFIQRLRLMFPGNGCGHSGGGNQVLTAATVSQDLSRNRSLATGESVDNFIQRMLSPDDPEPLTLAAGKTSSYLDEVLSYAEPLPGQTNGRLRSAERNPWEAYKSIFGEPDSGSDDYLYNLVVERRRSVNDMVRDQIDSLKRSPALSAADVRRLDNHQQAIRDLEQRMVACHLPDTEIGAIRQAGEDREFQDLSKVEEMSQMMSQIVALSFACGLKSAATLQIGNGNDQTKYDIGAGSQFPFHWISHRIEGDGGAGSSPDIANADYMHHLVDRIHMAMFKETLDCFAAYEMADGTTLLDQGVVMWCNDLGAGRSHSYRNVPFITAGSAAGRLRTGQHIDARDTASPQGEWVPHGQLFNTIINALGVAQADGSPVLDFGHKGGLGHDQPNGGEIGALKVG